MLLGGGDVFFDLCPSFGRDDVTDDKISKCLKKFRKCISVTLPQRFVQMFRCFAVRTKSVHPPLYRRRVNRTKQGTIVSKIRGLGENKGVTEMRLLVRQIERVK